MLRADDRGFLAVAVAVVVVAVVLVLVVAVVALGVQPPKVPTCALNVSVTTSSGPGIGGAIVSVQGQSGSTGSTGTYGFSGLRCGPTSVTASSGPSTSGPAFGPLVQYPVLLPNVTVAVHFTPY